MALFPWLARRRQTDDDLQAEIRSHLAMAAQDRMVPARCSLASSRRFAARASIWCR